MGHTVLALMFVDDEEVRLWRGGGGGALYYGNTGYRDFKRGVQN